MTKVSTITPCYNMSKYMKGFLDNLSTQTHKDLEIILDHNDPTDEEITLVEEYNKEHDNIFHIVARSDCAYFSHNFFSWMQILLQCQFLNLFLETSIFG